MRVPPVTCPLVLAPVILDGLGPGRFVGSAL